MPPYAWCSGTTRWRMFRRVGYMLLSPQSFVLLLSLLPFAFTLVCQECVNFSLMRWAPAGPSWTEVPVQPKTIRHPCQVLVEVKKEGFIMAEMEASTQVSGLPNFREVAKSGVHSDGSRACLFSRCVAVASRAKENQACVVTEIRWFAPCTFVIHVGCPLQRNLVVLSTSACGDFQFVRFRILQVNYCLPLIAVLSKKGAQLLTISKTSIFLSVRILRGI